MRKGLLVTLLVFACLTYLGAQTVRQNSGLVPSGKGYAVPGNGGPNVDTVHLGNGIDYHGGPIMPGTPNVYLIWYGKWNGGPKPSDSKTTVNLVRDFVTGISGSGYLMINSTYGDNTNDVTGLTALAGQVVLANYPLGKSLNDASINTIVSKVIAKGKLPSDPNGVYFVLTTSDVNETSGFCTFYCGWHTNAKINNVDIKYSFIGNPDRCPTGCEMQTTSPNNNGGADGMVNILAHELEEAISDPDVGTGPYAWYMNRNGQENADACAWMFGDLLPGSPPIGQGGYNENWGGHNWLIQMNWENARGGGCPNFLGGPFHSN